MTPLSDILSKPRHPWRDVQIKQKRARSIADEGRFSACRPEIFM
jgi:hypothetical protein